MENNIFINGLLEDCFRLEVVEKVYDDWKKSRKEGYVITKDKAYDALIEFFSEFDFSIEEFLDEEFADEDEDDK